MSISPIIILVIILIIRLLIIIINLNSIVNRIYNYYNIHVEKKDRDDKLLIFCLLDNIKQFYTN